MTLLSLHQDPILSGIRFHTAVLSVLCVIFQVQLSFVVSLSNVFLMQLTKFSLKLWLLCFELKFLLV